MKRMYASTWVVSTWVVTFGMASPLAGQLQPESGGASSITEDDIRWRVGVLAHDSMEGRDTPSRGLDRAADWIVSELRRIGLEGGAEDGDFIQRYPIVSTVVDEDRSALTMGGQRFALGTDALPLFGSATHGEAGGDVVVVSGSGQISRGAVRDVVGRHVVLAVPQNTPMNAELFQAVNRLRAAGVASVLIPSDMDDAAWSETRRRTLSANVTKGWGETGADVFSPVLQLRRSALEEVLNARGSSLAQFSTRANDRVRVHPLGDLHATAVVRTQVTEGTAPNVIGIVEGSDPQLRDEFVVFSAHMDHVGMGIPDESGDSIFNGADDDASGTAAVMEIAEAVAGGEVAPRRSMIFLFVSGEEKGLWGSEWYSEHPTRPLAHTVADLNLDMVGRNWTDTIVAIGKEHSDLGASLNRINGEHPELGMTAIDDLWPDERFYFRSDHYNFARKGVPVLFFFNGTHSEYHQRDDEVDRIDAEKAARIAKLVYYLGMDIGNADDRPKWNPESYARIVSEDR